jgi:hypothetical protein
VGKEPENERKAEAEDEASDDGKIKRGVLATVNDVAGKFSQTERKFSTEVENSTDEHEEAAEEEECTAEIAEGIHKSIIEEEPPGAFAGRRMNSRFGSGPILSVLLRIFESDSIDSNRKDQTALKPASWLASPFPREVPQDSSCLFIY